MEYTFIFFPRKCNQTKTERSLMMISSIIREKGTRWKGSLAFVDLPMIRDSNKFTVNSPELARLPDISPQPKEEKSAKGRRLQTSASSIPSLSACPSLAGSRFSGRALSAQLPSTRSPGKVMVVVCLVAHRDSISRSGAINNVNLATGRERQKTRAGRAPCERNESRERRSEMAEG